MSKEHDMTPAQEKVTAVLADLFLHGQATVTADQADAFRELRRIEEARR